MQLRYTCKPQFNIEKTGGGTVLPSIRETVRRRNIEVWTIQTSDRTPIETGAGGTELSHKRQNLNRSNREMCLQLKSANLRTGKMCLR